MFSTNLQAITCMTTHRSKGGRAIENRRTVLKNIVLIPNTIASSPHKVHERDPLSLISSIEKEEHLTYDSFERER